MKKTLLLFFISVSVFSQSINKEKLDAYFIQLKNNNKLFGSSAILKEGTIIYEHAIGFADVETKKENTTSTKFRVGSISKVFTTVLVFKAIEENKLSLTTTLDTYFPSVKKASSITIKNLLNHSSGIYNFTNSPDYANYFTSKKSRSELLDIINKYESDFEPGTKSSYSNSNFLLLTFIVEDVFKKPYADLIKEKITLPLQLNNTYVGSQINLEHNECNSYNYLYENWNKMPETHMSIPLGAGAIVSTPADLLFFLEALFTNKLISSKNLALMTTIDNGYGLGIFKYPFGNQYGFGHGGGIDGFKSILMYFPDKKIGIATTTNGLSPDFDMNNLSIALLSAANGINFEIPDFKVLKIDETILNKYSGTYASQSLPLKITIKVIDGQLSAQATGQSSFILKADSETSFSFKTAGIVIEFKPEQNEMFLYQSGKVFKFLKE